MVRTISCAMLLNADVYLLAISSILRTARSSMRDRRIYQNSARQNSGIGILTRKMLCITVRGTVWTKLKMQGGVAKNRA